MDEAMHTPADANTGSKKGGPKKPAAKSGEALLFD